MSETRQPVSDEPLSSASIASEDLDLVRAVLAGEEESIEVFAEKMRCVPRILAALNGRMGRPLDDHDLADLSQDILVILWRKLERYNGAAPLEGWVFHICRLELMNALRKKRRAPRSTETIESDDSDSTFLPQEPTEELREELRRGIDLLGFPTAEVVSMKHFGEMTFQEIGARLGISTNTAKTLYYRGLPRLSEYVRDRMGSEVG